MRMLKTNSCFETLSHGYDCWLQYVSQLMLWTFKTDFLSNAWLIQTQKSYNIDHSSEVTSYEVTEFASAQSTIGKQMIYRYAYACVFQGPRITNLLLKNKEKESNNE